MHMFNMCLTNMHAKYKNDSTKPNRYKTSWLDKMCTGTIIN